MTGQRVECRIFCSLLEVAAGLMLVCHSINMVLSRKLKHQRGKFMVNLLLLAGRHWTNEPPGASFLRQVK